MATSNQRWGIPTRFAAWIMVSVAVAGMLAVPARAELLIFPTRVVIEGDRRTAQVELVNRDTTPATYRVQIVNRRMTETGEIIEAKTAEAGEQFADGMVFFTPRQITLPPGASQVVRISVRKPATLAEGEYRSHLQFDRVPDTTGNSDLETVARNRQSGMSIELTALIGASIPVIVRHGATEVKTTIDGLVLDPARGEESAAVRFAMHRTGNQSVYGDITAIYTRPDGKAVEVGSVGGVAVYVPNAVRQARLPLRLPAGTILKGGTIKVRYTLRPEAGGALLAESQIPVP